MQTVNLIRDGSNQSIVLPNAYQFEGESVFIQKVGHTVLLLPIAERFEVFLRGIQRFSDDFMEEGRLQSDNQERDDI
jgi:antitoxin VapB